ncbi:hypothetical protein [Hymenobacter psychrophilus]|uniref:Uncharacterized protein n=1 Tax=Hymenobacter psychrophilus TaxID=651662 RepID=A0A1H3NF27_9BACT|nr:hypothetical protein [Hymenobacter psychrophilus]SDY87065.1 hypothetical protein SAMN04488069_11657 [Hymenobacter psychrophilus]
MSNKLSITDRLTLPTPRFFRKVRSISVAVGAVGAILVASPALLPAALVTLGGYLVLAGSIGAAVSSTAVKPGEQLDEAQSRKERMGGSSAETL